MEALQIYWWFVISLLGGLLVFLLFVQGGQTFLWPGRQTELKQLTVNVLGRKWELTFTTLVTFGGAFFASFPLYYSTSFGGAYWRPTTASSTSTAAWGACCWGAPWGCNSSAPTSRYHARAYSTPVHP